MPTYVYKCTACDKIFEIFHSYKEKMTNCTECGAEETLQKQLNTPIYLLKKKEQTKAKPGDLVKQEIKERKEELQQQKEELKKRNQSK